MKNVPWTLNGKLWTQFITVVTIHQSRQKSTLCWQKERYDGRKDIITAKRHSTTNGIHMRRQVWHLKGSLDETSNFEWSVVRCATP